jgi:hypothetical protein
VVDLVQWAMEGLIPVELVREYRTKDHQEGSIPMLHYVGHYRFGGPSIGTAFDQRTQKRVSTHLMRVVLVDGPEGILSVKTAYPVLDLGNKIRAEESTSVSTK